ncbi:MAG: DNA-deoxyinosine glycosylase [Hydrogenophaga sp.]|jgi:hypoxanthine-DNA glycosylase|uniref:DNA-deoxyinosine glycosylase n=1 Tax=Hydrogenophaga sp. TaxID=1904254 RepID=UPI0027243158|nr:DNA-deoxyinosine glycosylase [Hydrogenophaga sp.]MDO9203037.1 DNA-deoxyinosine glycosylase [Hydrogenophaga sp.]MDO9484424.1 DNA-deoxyinosine glycosylase [Hydrogenophaga sp.]MDO9569230.1 DNA-deoxyinosine glycosylase [Hydrogenophaga sp.]MDP2093750.1 DNA-deoxyinosine glycosylase [Hydrogenophaga sp.]MDP3346332.1 DNA-deoxyinosine glycosylase [Hydrogenophaga sp.]
MSRLQGLAPVFGPHTRLLVLGSFPGVASLRAQQYYGHPQNQFWKILGAVWALPLVQMPYPERISALHAHGLGLWDVYGACEREGSLDANIQAAELNDLAWLRGQCPQLRAIAHNGGESFRHARHTEKFGLPVVRLPSTSPANASWSFDRKLAAWAEVLQRYGLVPAEKPAVQALG